MLKNYAKTAWRNFLKNKGYSTINISGLALGMAVAILIGLWISDELSYNHDHENYEHIGHIMRHSLDEDEIMTGGQNGPMPLGEELRSSYGSDFTQIVLSTRPVDYVISSDFEKFQQSGRFMQQGAPEMLSLDMVYGSRAGLLEMNSILLSESLAKKLFGSRNPINETISIDTKIQTKVTGVYRDFPNNSEFSGTDYIAPFELYVSFTWARNVQDNWNDNSFPLYVQIAPHTTFGKVSEKIKDVMLPHLNEKKLASKPEVFIHPMSDWHLYSEFQNGTHVASVGLKVVWLYGLIGVFVLILACINFMNLSTAQSVKRAKEIGIRKSIGSRRSQLISQFLSESFLIAGFGLLCSVPLVLLVLPWFNDIAGKELGIPWGNLMFWAACMAFTMFTALLAGSYPAIYLSSFDPINALKGNMGVGGFAAIQRKALVVFQFTISIILIIGTIIVYQQIQFTKNRPIGYDQSGLLRLSKNSALTGKSEVLRNELLQTGSVYEVAESWNTLTNVGSSNTGFDWQGKSPGAPDDFATLGITQEYGKTIGWEFVDGRDFSRAFASDSSGIIINQTAAKLMQMENPVGQIVRSSYWHKGTDFKIIGVVKDMVMNSPFEPARPTMFSIKGGQKWIYIKIDPTSDAHTALSKIESVFNRLAPSAPFDYTFVNQSYASKFEKEERLGKTAAFLGILAILISCLGLFGLSAYVVEQRTKEIGIRKSLGASISNIWQLLSKDFLSPVLVSLLLAIPAAYYFLYEWLQGYTYRTEISWWVILATVLGVMSITLATVSFQAIKGAIADPVKSLRTE